LRLRLAQAREIVRSRAAIWDILAGCEDDYVATCEMAFENGVSFVRFVLPRG
jgi:hypothetical protein